MTRTARLALAVSLALAGAAPGFGDDIELHDPSRPDELPAEAADVTVVRRTPIT